MIVGVGWRGIGGGEVEQQTHRLSRDAPTSPPGTEQKLATAGTADAPTTVPPSEARQAARRISLYTRLRRRKPRGRHLEDTLDAALEPP